MCWVVRVIVPVGVAGRVAGGAGGRGGFEIEEQFCQYEDS